MTDETKILPCLFCGQVRIEPEGGCYSTSTLYVSSGSVPRAACSVHCTGCGASGPVESAEHKFTRRPFGETARAEWDAEAERAETKAIELWNRPSRHV